MKRFVLFVYFLLLVSPKLISAKTTIVVSNQKEFDNVRQQVLSCINAGDKDVYVRFVRGSYIVKENYLSFSTVNAPDVKLRIIGEEATLVPEGYEYRDGDQYIGTYNVNNSWMSDDKDVETWSYIQYADGLIEVLDVATKQCRLKSKKLFLSNTDYCNAYILIPHWYRSSVYKIDKIDREYIYFTANDLKESSYGGYNVNDDHNYGKKSIRYKLCNVEIGDDCLCVIDGKVRLPKDISCVWEGKTHCFLNFQNCKFALVEISGLQIRGNAFAKSTPAIYLKKTKCKEIKIHNCSFYGMRGNVISVETTPNVRIERNKFDNCYFGAINSKNGSVNTFVEDNDFTNMGKRMSSSPCVRCQGENYFVAGNTFLDFGYCGIYTGVWYKSKYKHICCGIIENNNLSFSKDYLNCIDNYGIMDGGAIYVATKNDGSVVRYNYIHGFSGMKSNRGVFCDDGAYNVEIYGNVIIDIANSRCIDSRRVAKVESAKTPESGIERANVNMIIRDNIIDGGIRFEANECQSNGCIKGANYILIANGSQLPQNVIKNIVNPMDDIELEYNGEKKDRVCLSPLSYRKMKYSPIWRQVRNYLEKM